MPVKVTFWGVRGSAPTPVRANLGVGGNTACVEIRTESQLMIFDAGTGIQRCGARLVAENGHAPREITVFLSHFHWDHLQGLPFFTPLYRPDFTLRFAHSAEEETTRGMLRRLMEPPYFPILWDATASRKKYLAVPSSGLAVGDLEVCPVPLNHPPQGATGYCILTKAGKIIYATDFEHGDPRSDALLAESARNARLLVCDAQYTPEEYEKSRQGWGHSTWLEAARIAREANVGRLILFHHDPSHTDPIMNSILVKARKLFANTDVAVEGSSICLD